MNTLHETNAATLIETHGLKTIEQAYSYLNDDRSHGDEYLAGAAQAVLAEMFGTATLPELSILPAGVLREYVRRCITRAEWDCAVADGAVARSVSAQPGAIGYNSYGEDAWTPLAEIKKLELERGNAWFDDRGLVLSDYLAIWVTKDPRRAIPYMDFPPETDDLYSDFTDELPPDPPADYQAVLEREYGQDAGNAWDELRALWANAEQRVPHVDLTGAREVLDDGDGGFIYIRPARAGVAVAAQEVPMRPLHYVDPVDKQLVINRVAIQDVIREFGLDVLEITAINENVDAALAGARVDHIGVLTIKYAPHRGENLIPGIQTAMLVVLNSLWGDVGFLKVRHSMDELAVKLYYTFEIKLEDAPAERIDAAAILGQDGAIHRGLNHAEILNAAQPFGALKGCPQGFVTSSGRFVDRAEAAAIAFAAKQIPVPRDILYSENLRGIDHRK